MTRRAGILAPVSTLGGAHGIGDFGKSAYEFVDLINKAGFKVWQILPLNPVGYGNSPYQPYSSYAGDEIYISLELLVEWGLLKSEEIDEYLEEGSSIDYPKVRSFKETYLHMAFERCMETGIERDGFHYFKEKHPWLFNYAAFITLKKKHDLKCWLEWPVEEQEWPDTYQYDIEQHRSQLEYEMFVQYVFYRQWFDLKKYANEAGIEIVGDIPIYVGIDSADVWTNKKCFLLDEKYNPTYVAGVPPDYFSKTGQRWGNPIYDWEYLKETDFQFWIDRLIWSTFLFDIVRIDHFRGFDTYWKIPVSCPTAEIGEWVEAPGYELFDMINKKIPDIHIVAEDLGDLREEVFELRDHYGLSGMKIVQFELDPYESNNDFKETQNTIVYTGTHDNQTLVGWYKNLSSYQKRKISQKFKKYKERKCTDRIIHAVFNSVADLVIFPVQDLLALDDAARINTPGTVGSPNWEWRLTSFDELKTVLPVYKKLIQKSKRKGNNLTIPN